MYKRNVMFASCANINEENLKLNSLNNISLLPKKKL